MALGFQYSRFSKSPRGSASRSALIKMTDSRGQSGSRHSSSLGRAALFWRVCAGGVHFGHWTVIPEIRATGKPGGRREKKRRLAGAGSAGIQPSLSSPASPASSSVLRARSAASGGTRTRRGKKGREPSSALICWSAINTFIPASARMVSTRQSSTRSFVRKSSINPKLPGSQSSV